MRAPPCERCWTPRARGQPPLRSGALRSATLRASNCGRSATGPNPTGCLSPSRRTHWRGFGACPDHPARAHTAPPSSMRCSARWPTCRAAPPPFEHSRYYTGSCTGAASSRLNTSARLDWIKRTFAVLQPALELHGCTPHCYAEYADTQMAHRRATHVFCGPALDAHITIKQQV